MKKVFKQLIVWLFIMLPAFVMAQSKESKRDAIAAMRVAFITEKLNLSSAEAQVFWPVYNEYQDKLDAIRAARRKDFKDGKIAFDAMNDKEVEQLVDLDLAYRQRELDLQKVYHTKFKSILHIKKVAKLYRAEEEFKKELLKQIKEKNG